MYHGGWNSSFGEIINASALYLTALYQFNMINVTETTNVNWFVCFDSLRPSQQFFSHMGTDLPALNQY